MHNVIESITIHKNMKKNIDKILHPTKYSKYPNRFRVRKYIKAIYARSIHEANKTIATVERCWDCEHNSGSYCCKHDNECEKSNGVMIGH